MNYLEFFMTDNKSGKKSTEKWLHNHHPDFKDIETLDKNLTKLMSSVMNGYDFLFIVENNFSNFDKLIRGDKIPESAKNIYGYSKDFPTADKKLPGVLCL